MPLDVYTLPGDSVFPEGITEGPGSTFFVGSLGDGTLFHGDARTGTVEVLFPPDGDGRVTTAGLDVDRHGRLISCDIKGGQLFVHDPAARTLVARRRFPVETAWPNDVVVAGDIAYVTDSHRPVVWQLPVPAGEVGEPTVAVDLGRHGAPDDTYLNGIVADAATGLLLVAGQGSGVLWRVDPGTSARPVTAGPVELDGYEFNADGMLLRGDVLYGVTNRGETMRDATFMISGVRLSPDRRTAHLLGELTDARWNTPTTIAQVDDRLLVVSAQLKARQAKEKPELPFEVVAMPLPTWAA